MVNTFDIVSPPPIQAGPPWDESGRLQEAWSRWFNSIAKFSRSLQTLPIYANNAAAVTGGLSIGEFYRTGANPDTVCVVH